MNKGHEPWHAWKTRHPLLNGFYVYPPSKNFFSLYKESACCSIFRTAPSVAFQSTIWDVRVTRRDAFYSSRWRSLVCTAAYIREAKLRKELRKGILHWDIEFKLYVHTCICRGTLADYVIYAVFCLDDRIY